MWFFVFGGLLKWLRGLIGNQLGVNSLRRFKSYIFRLYLLKHLLGCSVKKVFKNIKNVLTKGNTYGIINYS